jgi:hypothetical protein
MTLDERLAECERLHRKADSPRACLLFWYELQGLLVAAGKRQPMELTAEADGSTFVDAYVRGLEDGRSCLRCAGALIGGRG